MGYRHVAAAFLLLPVMSLAQTGSGTVEFEFTGFAGPIARSLAVDASEWSDPATWIARGLVNGASPTPDGWVSAGPTISPVQPIGYVTGAETLGGVGALSFRYTNVPAGSVAENLVSFAPRPFDDVSLGESFVLGTLTFKNGGWFGGGTSAAFNTPTNLQFRITTTSADGAAFNQTITGEIRVVVHAPSPSPESVTLFGRPAYCLPKS